MSEVKPAPQSDEDNILAALEAMNEAGDDQSFGDLSAILDAETQEEAGQWFDWPALKDARVHIAHLRNAADRHAELERKFRVRKGQMEGELAPSVATRLWEESLFGSVVLGWEGIRENGFEVVFNLENFRKLMKVHRFRTFMIERSRSIQAKRDAVEAKVGKG